MSANHGGAIGIGIGDSFVEGGLWDANVRRPAVLTDSDISVVELSMKLLKG